MKKRLPSDRGRSAPVIHWFNPAWWRSASALCERFGITPAQLGRWRLMRRFPKATLIARAPFLDPDPYWHLLAVTTWERAAIASRLRRVEAPPLAPALALEDIDDEKAAPRSCADVPAAGLETLPD